jgi:transposase
MTYSVDFRKKVLDIKEKEGLSFAKVAERFSIGIASVVRWTKNIDAKIKRNKPATKIDMELLKKDIEEYPDAYQYERGERLGVSAMGIGHALKRLGVTYKKNPQSSKSKPRKTICFLPNIK